MAETIALPGGKKVNKNVVYIGGAAALGFVGYAWFKNGTTPEISTEGLLPEPVPEPTDTPGFTASGGEVTGQPRTNDEWTQLAVNRLINIGIDAPAVLAAIGKFLQRKPLTTVEASLVQQALAIAGQPPVGGPYVIIPVTTGGSTTVPPKTPTPAPKPPATAPKPVGVTPPVTGFVVAGGKNVAWLAWRPVPGATGYEVSRLTANSNTGWQAVGNRTSYVAPTLVRAPTKYAFAIRAFHPKTGYSPQHTHSKTVVVYP